MTDTEAMKLVAMLVAAYPHSGRLDEEAILAMTSAYRTLLADLDADAALSAVKRLIATSRWIPTIAEIRAAVVEVEHGLARAPLDAWGDVRQAIMHYGSYRTPGVDFVFDDPLVAHAVERLGWDELCSSEFVQSDRARFVELYTQLVESHRREHVVAGLLATASPPRLRGGTTTLAAPITRALLGSGVH